MQEAERCARVPCDDLQWARATGCWVYVKTSDSTTCSPATRPSEVLEEAQQKVDRVEQAARETAHDGAVDPDVLEVVARVLLDEPDGALGAEREHALLDEGCEAVVVALDRLDHPCLDPAVDLPAQRRVGRQRAPRALESLDHPRGRLRVPSGEVGGERRLERRRRLLDDVRRRGCRQQVPRGGLDATREVGLAAQPRW